MDEPPLPLLEAVAARSQEIVAALDGLAAAELEAPSDLPGWSRLTIACHLRYGAEAFRRMTEGAVAGQPVAYYPEGRKRQRPRTLRPEPDESPHQVVDSLQRASERLDRTWRSLEEHDWSLVVTEPTDNPDLGPQRVGSLPLLRLTEVEVHGTDLDLGLSGWSDVFVRTALPFRLDWLNRRRTNHRRFDSSIEGSWLLTPSDGRPYLVTTTGDRVAARPAEPGDEARATIAGTSRDLLALLLGRRPEHGLRHGGDVQLAQLFERAFPGP